MRTPSAALPCCNASEEVTSDARAGCGPCWFSLGPFTPSIAFNWLLCDGRRVSSPQLTVLCVRCLCTCLCAACRRGSGVAPGLDYPRSSCEPMDCSRSFEVVAEVRPLSPGSRTGSMCSASSGSSQSPTHMQQQASSSLGERMSTSSSAALLVSGKLAGNRHG